MIISDKYKYLFIEFPRTASTAIAKELLKYYDGTSILHKHATYHEFLKVASGKEKTYFVFSTIRNPLDKTVSAYLKLYSYWQNKDLSKYDLITKLYMRKRLKFIKNKETNFPIFFNKFYHLPYDDWSILDHKKFAFIIRYENIQNDFSEVLKKLNIKQKRALPIINKTENKKNNFYHYYTPEIRKKAKRIFSPYMQKWGYHFPNDCGKIEISLLHKIILSFINIFRKVYFKRFYNIHIRKKLNVTQ